MPQKKNPDACELIRGKTGRVYGDLTSLLTTLKGLPLSYNKDMQEDKEPVFDTIDTLLGCLKIMSSVIRETSFNGPVMLEAASEPYLAATDIADDLVRSGLPFREAHARVGELIRNHEQSTEALDGSKLPSPLQMVEARRQPGATAKNSVTDQITIGRRFVEDVLKFLE
jgi:argininosuccinate lyase